MRLRNKENVYIAERGWWRLLLRLDATFVPLMNKRRSEPRGQINKNMKRERKQRK